ncbi:MAG TPA: hypothetical protein VHP37_01240 [Burkholderiales bacterium]|nr:hypothetical protein [Burkholderiales bacterium]
MSGGITLEAFGVRVAIRADSADALERVRRRFPYAVTARAEGPVTATFALGGEEEIDRLEAAVRLTIAEHAPERVFVHAGVVAWNERAIVVPGPSFSGKSTLVAALVRAGATYYSDEYAVCLDSGAIEPFVKPLELRREGEHAQYAVDVPMPAHGAMTAGLVIVTRYVAGAAWQPRAISRGAGVLRLLENAVAARSASERALRALGAVVSSAIVLEGDRGDADETAAAMLARAGAY